VDRNDAFESFPIGLIFGIAVSFFSPGAAQKRGVPNIFEPFSLVSSVKKTTSLTSISFVGVIAVICYPYPDPNPLSSPCLHLLLARPLASVPDLQGRLPLLVDFSRRRRVPLAMASRQALSPRL
jgi:hypothetical protein